MLDRDAAPAVTRYLALADRLLPARISGFYVVGSAALGSWHADQSDIDFVAVVEGGPLDGRDLRRLRALHVLGNLTAAGRALVRAQPAIPGTMNGVFVSAADLGRPVTRIRPLASHSGPKFKPGVGFDVNPVMWKVLLERGIVVRGEVPGQLGLDPEPDRLRAWNLEQLHGHYQRWAERAHTGIPPRKRLIPAHRVAMANLLAPVRLHHTIATGEVISKEAAAEYALDTFAARWHPLIRTALAHRTGAPVPAGLDPSLADPVRLPRLAGEFMLEVIADADRL